MRRPLHACVEGKKKLNLGKAKIFQKIPIVGLVMSDSYWLKAHLCLVCRRSSVRCQTTTIASYCGGALEISRPISFVPMSANWSAALILTIASNKLGDFCCKRMSNSGDWVVDVSRCDPYCFRRYSDELLSLFWRFLASSPIVGLTRARYRLKRKSLARFLKSSPIVGLTQARC